MQQTTEYSGPSTITRDYSLPWHYSTITHTSTIKSPITLSTVSRSYALFKPTAPSRHLPPSTMSHEQLAREHDQLVYEQSMLDMPFLEEDLAFLAEFDGHPEVSVHEVLDILQAEKHDNINTTAEAAPSVQTAMGAFDAPEVDFGEHLVNYSHATTTMTESAPAMNMFNTREHDITDELFASIAPTTNGSSSTTTTAAATPGSARDAGAFKKSCKTCAARKIKCEIVQGSNPKVCKHCSDKSLACEFDLKKTYTKAQS
ncbi:hypothetical protein QM012_005532 [Aureobasidium pullulans]|uniref:Zn(2)-C6 fungal-type domain-containing protein n=1 Tax=Aureobasidium pullulans TaxID=5580 RepID=A0ABR0T5L6_AURPU